MIVGSGGWDDAPDVTNVSRCPVGLCGRGRSSGQKQQRQGVSGVMGQRAGGREGGPNTKQTEIVQGEGILRVG